MIGSRVGRGRSQAQAGQARRAVKSAARAALRRKGVNSTPLLFVGPREWLADPVGSLQWRLHQS